MDKQAITIIRKFGKPRDLHRALLDLNDPEAVVKSPSCIYKWTYPKPIKGMKKPGKYGTGGLIPHDRIPYIRKAARLKGIVILPDEWAGGEL